MIRLALIALTALAALVSAALFAPVLAEDRAELHALFGGGDTLVLERGEGVTWHLVYTNSARQNSRTGFGENALGDLVVEFEIYWGESNREGIVARPRGGYVAIPDRWDVTDGDSITLLIAPAMF